MKIKNLLLLCWFCSLTVSAQLPDTYPRAYDFIHKMLTGEIPLNFEEAVFATQNAYCEGKLDREEINRELDVLVKLTQAAASTPLITYTGRDKETVTKHAALFKVITDSIPIAMDSVHTLVHLPYRYDFEDIFGDSDWKQMFVSKLLVTGKGNCHSLPYLYKIISDRLHIPCYLSFAPNHLYIKLFSEATGWYNTELTSATFPVDAWIIASGYVPTEAIRNGLYMDTLTNRQAVANCLLDLAQGYQRKFGREDPGFVLQCCRAVLTYHPVNVNALLTKAEALKYYIRKRMGQAKNGFVNNDADKGGFAAFYAEMEETYVRLYELGYRRMPQQMYLQWLNLLKDKPKYQTNY